MQQVILDREGCVWAGTDYGLARYTPKDSSVMSLIPASTLLGNMFIENAVTMLADGRLAFGSRHGIIVIDPTTVPVTKSLFQPCMTNVVINGVSIHDFEQGSQAAMLNDKGGISLDHNENSLTFHFSDFEYNESMVSKYTYRLKGYDKEWSPMSLLNFAVYRNLPPGKYVMEVKVKNSNGVWNDTIISLPVNIRPPFWATWWAYLIYILIVAAIVWFTYQHFKRVNELNNRIKVEQQLTEYKMQFFTNISHEFRTPLTIIRGAMERIKATDKVPGEMKQPIYSMQKSSDRLLRMVNQLMEFSKMHEGKLHLAVEETEAVSFLRDIFSTFRGMAETKHISYQFTANAQQIPALLDRNFLDKIAYNLISNAFKYTPNRHDIIVRVKQQEDWLLFVVEDTGIGIPKDKQKELFERFNQSVFSRDSIGIGLHLTHELVRVHHGTIQFEENPKGGCIFTVSLPMDRSTYVKDEYMQTESVVAKEEEQNQWHRAVEEYKEMPPVPINKRHILIVEDDGDIRDYLQHELQQYFIVESANDGQEALEKIEEERPELIVSDVMMPIMNGYELTRRIRANEQWSDIPIILLTAMANEADELKGIKSGAEIYIKKPFSPNMLISVISKTIEQRDKLKVTYAKEVKGHTPTPGVITNQADKRFRDQLETWMQSHISDTQVTAESLAQSLGYGRTAFFRKVKLLTGMTPNDYIRKIRLEKAAELLLTTNLTAAEVAYKVGFEDQYYFSKSFKKYYGVPPTKYRRGETQPQEQINNI